MIIVIIHVMILLPREGEHFWGTEEKGDKNECMKSAWGGGRWCDQNKK